MSPSATTSVKVPPPRWPSSMPKEEAKVLIGEHPQLGSTRLAAETDIPEMHTLALRGLPSLAFSSNDADAVRVHRVLHTARDIPSGFPDG